MEPLTILSQIIGFIIALTVHEFSHAYVAYKLGDPTAKFSGRLTFNPIKHIDPIGTVVVPLFFLFTSSFIIGWAKPVPVNKYNLKGRYADTWVSLAGPLSNFITAFLVLLFFLKLVPSDVSAAWSDDFQNLFQFVALINIAIGIFNLLPVPPLDGSHILRDLLPYPAKNTVDDIFNQYGWILFIFVIFIGSFIITIGTQLIMALYLWILGF
jgi:Zn-dependent protease